MNESVIIRPIAESETGFLDEMLYNAIFVPPGAEKLPENIIELPEIKKYIKDFGKDGDYCFVAEINGELAGAIWTRHFDETNKSYGFVDSDTPELSMALYEQYRNKGIGTMLLNRMIKNLTDRGYRQVSLSVDKINYAYSFYKKTGFKDYESAGDSMTMLMKLK